MLCSYIDIFKLMSQTPEVLELKLVFCCTVHLKLAFTVISSIKFQAMSHIVESRNLVNR
jgi:hypothetical protein